jgi:disulfide bond formation protein DsbB
MKTKRTIYFVLIPIGAAVMAIGESFIRKEYALALGIIILMFGIYKSSVSWGIRDNGLNKEP